MSEHVSTDQSMVKAMSLVMGSLVVFTLIIIALARIVTDEGEGVVDPLMAQAQLDRIQPVGQVRTSLDDVEVASTAAAADTAAAEGDQAVAADSAGDAGAGGLTDNIRATVEGLCASCHTAGIAGAPKIGDQAAWDERAAAGLDAMTQAVINGKGAMPPRAGSTLTDDEIPLAIEYLMSL